MRTTELSGRAGKPTNISQMLVKLFLDMEAIYPHIGPISVVPSSRRARLTMFSRNLPFTHTSKRPKRAARTSPLGDMFRVALVSVPLSMMQTVTECATTNFMPLFSVPPPLSSNLDASESLAIASSVAACFGQCSDPTPLLRCAVADSADDSRISGNAGHNASPANPLLLTILTCTPMDWLPNCTGYL